VNHWDTWPTPYFVDKQTGCCPPICTSRTATAAITKGHSMAFEMQNCTCHSWKPITLIETLATIKPVCVSAFNFRGRKPVPPKTRSTILKKVTVTLCNNSAAAHGGGNQSLRAPPQQQLQMRLALWADANPSRDKTSICNLIHNAICVNVASAFSLAGGCQSLQGTKQPFAILLTIEYT